MKSANIIKLSDVKKSYQIGSVKIEALRGINLEIKQNEFVSIIGPSGSGKSTLVNMVGCLDVPTQGDVYLRGENISHFTESELAQTRGKFIGFVFQQFNLIKTLTALENVALPLMFQGIEKEERLARAQEILEIVELGDRMYNKPNEMSGGQQQRVAIARALANDPDLILADEPTGNLDSRTGEIVMDFFKKLKQKQKKTIVLVTHDMNVAKQADRIVKIKDGKVVNKL